MSERALRPAEVCRALLTALDAAEGRRRQRKRDQTPDAIGLAVKREILLRIVREDPDSEQLEERLMCCVSDAEGTPAAGATAAMARSVFEEWRLAHELGAFAQWLDGGAPSADASDTTPRPITLRPSPPD